MNLEENDRLRAIIDRVRYSPHVPLSNTDALWLCQQNAALQLRVAQLEKVILERNVRDVNFKR